MLHFETLTMYRAPVSLGESFRRYQRQEAKTLAEWYASFDALVDLAANEALLDTLETAAIDGYAAAHDDTFVYLFFEGRHPATIMQVDGLVTADLTVRHPSPDELTVELGRRRIAWSPKAFNAQFISQDIEAEAPDHEIGVGWGAMTRQAVLALKGFGFEDCETFFGDRIISLAKDAAEAEANP